MANENPFIPILDGVFEIAENIQQKASPMEYFSDLVSIIPAIIGSAQQFTGATKEQIVEWAGGAADYLVGGTDSKIKTKFPGLTDTECEQLTDLVIKVAVAAIEKQGPVTG